MKEKQEIKNTNEPLMQPGEIIDLAVGAAINRHIAAKNIAHIDGMRQESTMRDLVALASTREGLAALQKTQSQE